MPGKLATVQNREQRFMLFLKACTSERVTLVYVLIKKRIGHFWSTIVLSSLFTPLVNLKFIVRGCTYGHSVSD